MKPGGLCDRHFVRLLMVFFLFVLLISPYANQQQVTLRVSNSTEVPRNSSILDIEHHPIISDTLPTPLEFDSPVTFHLNSSLDNCSYTVDIPESGILLINWSFEVMSAGLTGPHFSLLVNESAVRYVPQLDQYVPDEVSQQPMDWWHELPLGFTFHENKEIFTVNSGYVDLLFLLDWQNTIDNVTVNLEASWTCSFGDPTPIPIDQNCTLDWTSDDTWENALLTIPEDGLYNIGIESYLPYNLSALYAGPSSLDVPERVFILSKSKGTFNPGGATTYMYYYPEHFVSSGSADTSFWSDSDLVQLIKGDYYVVGLSGLFKHLNGTSLNVTINVKAFSAIRLNPNESIDLNFNTIEPQTKCHVAVYLPEGNLSSLRFSNPIGGNWTVSSSYYPSITLGVPSFTYMKYPNSEHTTENRFNDIFVMATSVVMIGHTPRTTSVSGEHFSDTYQPYGFSSSYINGEQTSYTMTPMYIQIPFPLLFLELSATPAAMSFSDTFSLTMSLDTTPFIELDESITTASFNTTLGPIIEFYRFSVQSGHTYNITATPAEYTSDGVVVFAMLPSTTIFDQWSIVEQPLIAKTNSDYPSYFALAAQATNRTASIEFMAAIDGEITIYGAGGGLSMGDCTEAEFRMEETPPTSLEFGDSIPLSTQDLDFFGFEVSLIEGYDYELTIQLDPSICEASVTFFDGEGVNPFATTEEEIWLEVDSSEYLYKTFTLSSHHSGQAFMGLILEGSATVAWDVVDIVPPELSITNPMEGSRFEPGTIAIEFSAEDNIELKSLNISIGDNPIPLNLTATSYEWVIETMGVYEIILTAEDTHGNIATSQIIVIVEYESYMSLELLVFSGLGTFGGVIAIGIIVSRRRGGM